MNQVVDRIPTGFPTKVIGLISSIKYLIYCERNIDKKLSLFSIENGFTKDLKKDKYICSMGATFNLYELES